VGLWHSSSSSGTAVCVLLLLLPGGSLLRCGSIQLLRQ
jgi:hypothetical protein